jgi:hypothetical protein
MISTVSKSGATCEDRRSRRISGSNTILTLVSRTSLSARTLPVVLDADGTRARVEFISKNNN